MGYKKSLIMLVLVIFIFGVASVSASDVNDTIVAGEDTGQMELSAGDEMTVDNLQTSEGSNILAQIDNEKTAGRVIDSKTLTAGEEGNYSQLREEIGSGGDKNLTKSYYRYYAGEGSSISIETSGIINGNGAIIDMAGSITPAFVVMALNVTIKNLTIINSVSSNNGGAIYFGSSGTVENCTFINNTAHSNDGGAVYFGEGTTGRIINCNFINNTANQLGGAVYFRGVGDVTNCTFINNNNTAYFVGDVLYFYNNGTVLNCNFTNMVPSSCQVTFGKSAYARVINCNFINNTGMAIIVDGKGAVMNCNFTNTFPSASVVIIVNEGNVTNCNFVDNSVKSDIISLNWGNVANCTFINNTAEESIASLNKANTVANCTFINNTAGESTVIFIGSGAVTNCNFTGNNAPAGSAVYFLSGLATKIVSKSIFLNNRANVDSNTPLNVTLNGNNIEIIFMGQNNLLNAIYSSDDAEVTFANVTYWGAEGITNITSATLPGSNREAGQNITVGVVVNDKIVLDNVVHVTDANGEIVLKNINLDGNYFIRVRHDEDSYYTEAEKIVTNMKFSVNVNNQTTNNRTVNITAKSNIIKNDVIPGGLMFILPNGTQINANYGGNGLWWAEHTFDNYTTYQVNATYIGLDNVSISNATINITRANSKITLHNITLDYGESRNVTVETVGATKITASINGTNATVLNNFTIQISGLGAGNYTLTVTTVPDDDHNPVTETAKITVDKAYAGITVDSATVDINVLDEVPSGATLTPEDAGNLTYVSNNSKVAIVENGKIKALAKGAATITVSFAGNENYTAAVNKTIDVTVNVHDASVNVTNSTLHLFVGDNFTIVATTVPRDLNVTYVVDNSGVISVDEKGVVTALKNGTASITVKVGGDGVYAENSTAVAVTVSKVPTEITVDTTPLDLFVGDEIVIVANLTPAGAGNVTFTSSDYDVVDFDFEGNVIAQGKGQAIITVSFAGDNKYAAAENKTIIINVSLGNASVTVDNDTLDLKVGETSAINATKHPDTIMLDITYTSSNNSVVTVDKKGIVTAVGKGTAVITVEVGDDEIYAKNSTNVTVTVSKIPTEITIANATVNMVIGDKDVDLGIGLMPSDAGKPDYMSSDLSVVVVNGDGTFTAIGDGIANVTVSFAGDDKYAASESKNITVIVSLKDASVSVINSTADLKVGDTFAIVATTDPAGLPVVYVPDNSGVVSVDKNGKITALKAGTAVVTVKVGDGKEYARNSTSVTVTVSESKISTKIVASAVTTVYNANKYLIITLKDASDNPVSGVKITVNLNGAKTYTTNNNGQVKISTKGLAPKTYTAKITFNGNSKYDKSAKSVKVTVKKANPKMVIHQRTYKLNVKVKAFAVILKDNAGKAIRNTQVRLRVGGVNYYATTNKNGKAIFKISKLNKIGTFKVVVSYKGNGYYNKLTKTSKIKVISAFKTVSKGSKNSAVVKKIQRL